MSYEIERKVLTNFIVDTNSSFGLSPFGIDHAPVDLQDNSGFMAISKGFGRRSSTGAPGANRHDYAGVLAITLVTPGKDGSAGATGFIDPIIAAFTGLKLDEAGNQPTISSAVVIDFEPPGGGVPYVDEQRQEAPYLRTVVNCPFVRTELK